MINNSQHDHLKMARTRIIIILGFLMLGFAIMSWRLTSLSLLLTENNYTSHGKKENNSSSFAYAPRADITDRNGIVLATTLKMPMLYADPTIIPSMEVLNNIALDISQVLPVDKETIAKKLHRSGRFIPLFKGLTPKQQKDINELGYPSLGFRESFRRVYPEQNLVSHILGYTDSDGLGIAGIEKQYEETLTKPSSIALTIDVRLQHILKRELKKSINNFEAIGGSGVIMNVKNGEILAMVSLPDFDPNLPSKAKKIELFNRNTTGVFEMGSTFKLFSIAAALEYGTVKESDKFNVSEPFKFGSHTIKDFHREKKPLKLSEVFSHSSNIGTAQIAEKLGTEKLRKFYKNLGLLNRLELDLPERAYPLLPRKWRDINTITASYGHGMAVTSVHLVRAASAIVNNGILPTPRLLMTPKKKYNPEIRIISAKTSKIMRGFLAKVINDEKGTGKKAFVAGYDMGGKTGTAEKITSKKYDEKLLYSSFLGVFPISEPEYIILVSIDEPKGQKDSYGFATGGWTAAPVIGKVVSEIAPLLGMIPQQQE